MQRILVPAYGPQSQPLKLAFWVLDKLVVSHREISDVSLFFFERVNFKDAMVAKLVGPSAEKALLAGKTVPFSEGANLRFTTLRTIERAAPPDAILLFYASEKMLAVAEALPGLQALVVVPWTIGRIEKWVQRELPIIPGDSINSSDIDSVEVAEALWALTLMVNPQEEPLSKSGEAATLELLDILHSNGLLPELGVLERWAQRNRWSLEAARQLVELAQRVRAGKLVEKEVYWGSQPLRYFRGLAEKRASRATGSWTGGL